MSISREFVQELNAAADILQIIGERVSLQRRGGNNYFGLCPFHSEKTPSFSVNPNKGFYHCFGCGVSGSALNFIIQLECGGDFIRGVESLAQRLGVEVPRGKDDGRGLYFRALMVAMNYFRQHFKKSDFAKDYLKSRGIDEATINKFYLGYAPNQWHGVAAAISAELGKDDKSLLEKVGLLRKHEKGDFYDYFRNRLMFPIMEGRERVNGFGGRALADDDMVKYLNSPESPLFSKKNMVFGIPQARDAIRDKNRVLVVEGYMDVVSLSQSGFAESVAVMGTAFATQQMRKITKLSSNIILSFDGDLAGREAAWRCLPNILPTLSDGMSVRFLFLPEKEDPDSFVRTRGKDGMEEAIANAKPLGEYMATRLWEQQKATSEEGRASAALAEGQKLVAMLNADKAPYLREVLMNQLSQQAGIGKQVMQKEIARPARVARGDNKTRFRMRPQGMLFNFLSCLAAHPHFWNDMDAPPPLLGNAGETEVVAQVLHYLRTRRDEDDEVDIIGFLMNEGFVELSHQVKKRVREGFGTNPQVEFKSSVARLHEYANKSKTTPYRTGLGGKRFVRPPKREPGESE